MLELLDAIVLISVAVIGVLGLRLVNVGQNKSRSARNESYAEALKIKSDVITELKNDLRQTKGRLNSVNRGPSSETDVKEDDLAGLVDQFAPRWLKKLVTPQQVQDIIEKNPDKVKEFMEGIKKQIKPSSQGTGPEEDAL